jgi:hypothetical protein
MSVCEEEEWGEPRRKARGFPHSGAAEPRHPVEAFVNLDSPVREPRETADAGTPFPTGRKLGRKIDTILPAEG